MSKLLEALVATWGNSRVHLAYQKTIRNTARTKALKKAIIDQRNGCLNGGRLSGFRTTTGITAVVIP